MASVSTPSDNSSARRESQRASVRGGSFSGDAFRIGTAAFFRHCFWLAAFILIAASFFYLSAGRLGSSFKDLIQRKVNEKLAGSGIEIAFADIQFVDGEGIRIDNLEVFLSEATSIATQSPPSNDLSTHLQNPSSTGWHDTNSALTQSKIGANRFVPVVPDVPGIATGGPSSVPASVGIDSPDRESLVAKHENHNFRPFYPVLAELLGKSRRSDIRIKQLWLRGQWNPATFLSGEFEPDSIEITSPELNLSVTKEGKIRFPNVRLPKPQKGLPGSIHVSDCVVNLTCERTAEKQWPITISHLQLDRMSGDVGENFFEAQWLIAAELGVLGLPSVSVNGQCKSGDFAIRAAGQPTHLHTQLWQQLRPWFPDGCQFTEGINGWLQLQELTVAGSLPIAQTGKTFQISQFNLSGNVRQMQFQDPRLPQPVLDFNGDFVADLHGFRCDNAKGRIGDGTFHISGQVTDWRQPVGQARVVTHDIRFTRRWVPLLPEKMQNDWQKFQPEGLMSCDMHFAKLGDGTITKEGTLDVKEMNYVFADFPVPISGAAGRFELENRNCTFNLNVSDPLYPLSIDGFANNIGPDWTGKVNIRSTQFHAIHHSTLEGLKSKPQVIKVIQEINPSGQMAINGFIEKKQANQKADVIFNVGFRDGVVQHQRFPYRVAGIVGEMRYENGGVYVQRLEGVSSTGNIAASGQFVPGRPWNVRVVGQAVELNTELYHALAPSQQEIWEHLRPRGVLDEVIVDLYDEQGQCKVRVSGSQKTSTLSDPSYLSINPDWFPYQLDGISGKFLYENNQVFLSGIHGSHGTVSVAFDGKGQTTQDDWQVTIYNLLTGQIPVGRDIKAALPETVKTAAEQLKLAGSVSVQGSVTISREAIQPVTALVGPSESRVQPQVGQQPLASNVTDVHRLKPSQVKSQTYRMQDDGHFQLQSLDDSTASQFPASVAAATVQSGAKLAWDLRLDMEDASLQVGLPTQHVHGMVQLTGESSTTAAYCRGALNIDSAMIEGIQVTGIQGPIWMNEREIVFGSQVAIARDQTTPAVSGGGIPSPSGAISSVTMETMGGRIGIDGRVLLVDDMPFSIRSSVNHMNLAKMAATFAPETRDIAGQGFASLNLHGSSVGTHTLSGDGMVRINNARLYEVPLFLQLLKVLRVRTPDKTAFDEGKIDFQIAGDVIEMSRIELNGDAISLLGRGQANLNQEIDLDFYTVLGRNQFYFPLVSDLLHASSQQLLTIMVDGTVDNPQIKHETGRALNEAVRLFVEDVEASQKLN